MKISIDNIGLLCYKKGCPQVKYKIVGIDKVTREDTDQNKCRHIVTVDGTDRYLPINSDKWILLRPYTYTAKKQGGVNSVPFLISSHGGENLKVGDILRYDYTGYLYTVMEVDTQEDVKRRNIVK